MKRLAAAFLCLFTLTTLVQAGATLKDARKEWLEGYYAEARTMFETLAKDPKTRLPATLGLTRVLESIGEYDKAQAALEALLKDEPKNAELLARLSEFHFIRGRLDEAEKTAQAALAVNKDDFLAHWILGQSYRDRGQTQKADAEFKWFVAASRQKNITDPEELRLTGLAGLEHARLYQLTDQFQTIIDDYFRVANKTDKRYWQGEYEAGRVFMDKHNKPGAFNAFGKVMIINPRSAEVLVARGQMAASSMEFKDAEYRAEQALKINPRYVPALHLISDVHWFSSEDDASTKALERARAVNPRDEGTLARLAALQYVKGDRKAFQAFVDEAQKNNPKSYTFYSDLASLLEQRKMNPDAEKYYNLAMAMQPKYPEAPTGLGMLYMRMAKEAEARKFLEKARDADEFNVRVANSLKVLNHLDRYETKETEHFILRFDKKNDEVLASFMAIYLEEIYKELADQFDYRPKGPFQIQIFREHQMFSGRIVAVPDLHTIGACTGPLVAMVSPKDTSGVIAKPFNWNRVIRHELVHVFNLQQTNGKVPHWFTEGLAVRYEGPNIPPSWHALLADKFHTNDLLDLDNILLGFIRPRSPLQWQQAYLQSLLYVEYLTKTHGEKSIGKMLAAFQEGLDTGPALEKAVGVKKETFEKGYLAFLAEKVKNLPARVVRKEMTLKQLREAHDKNPDDLDVATQLAEKNYNLGKKKDAKELIDKILRKEPKNTSANYLKALVLVEEGNAANAVDLLERITADENLKDTKPLKLLARLQVLAKQLPQAVRTCERGRKIDPHDTSWLLQLRDLYVKTKETDKLLEVAEEVSKLDPDEIAPRRLLANHNAKLGKHAEAAKFARMALEIDVTDRECQRILVDALEGLNRGEEAGRLKKIFGL